MILALDPGIAGCGVAIVEYAPRAELMEAAYVKNVHRADDPLADADGMGLSVLEWARDGLRGLLNPISEVFAEWPRVYRAGRAKVGADPNDLLLLTAVNASVVRALDVPASSVEPRQWKGTLGETPDGEYLVELRLRGEDGRPGLLSANELACVRLPSAKSLAHNVWDAAGIGLHKLGRGLMQRRRVIAR